jgi:hypothetical protein
MKFGIFCEHQMRRPWAAATYGEQLAATLAQRADDRAAGKPNEPRVSLT